MSGVFSFKAEVAALSPSSVFHNATMACHWEQLGRVWCFVFQGWWYSTFTDSYMVLVTLAYSPQFYLVRMTLTYFTHFCFVLVTLAYFQSHRKVGQKIVKCWKGEINIVQHWACIYWALSSFCFVVVKRDRGFVSKFVYCVFFRQEKYCLSTKIGSSDVFAS